MRKVSAGLQGNPSFPSPSTAIMSATQLAAAPPAEPVLLDSGEPTVREAWFYRKLEGGAVRCQLCHQHGVIAPGERSPCSTRENRDGTLVVLTYGRVVACNADPIERRGLFHFHPGSRCLSLASPGCNLCCCFCENWDLSQSCKWTETMPLGTFVSPRDAVRLAQLYECSVIASAYTEPTVSFEYGYQIASQARAAGLHSVWVTNAQMHKQPLRLIASVLEAVNVDLKCFSEQSYSRLCCGRLTPVLNNVGLLKELGVHLEVSTPLIPGVNDSEDELRRLTRFLVSVDPDIPWHVGCFHPDFRMKDVPMTSPAALRRACEIGREAGLRYVYGKLPGCPCAHTYCPGCGALVLKRLGAYLEESRLVDGACPECGYRIAGVGLDKLILPPAPPDPEPPGCTCTAP